ncbi:MAG: hypothetical protein ACPG4X_14640 [Pikeienuella sp.]
MAIDENHPYPQARAAYLKGATLFALKRCFELTDEELRDVAPEEFDDHAIVEPVRGY